MASTINTNLKLTHENELKLAAKENSINTKLGGVSSQLKSNQKKFRAILWKLSIRKDTADISDFTLF